MKAKPIFIITCPNSIPNEEIVQIKKRINKQLAEEYHCLMISSECDDFEFQVVAERKFTTTEWKALQKETNKIIKP